jgi:hypothetical protein
MAMITRNSLADRDPRGAEKLWLQAAQKDPETRRILVLVSVKT